MKTLMLVLTLLISCTPEEINWEDKPTSDIQILDKYKEIIFSLQVTLDSLSNKLSDMADADNRLLILMGQLNTITKVFQTEIYGEDCINGIEMGCPKIGSALDRLTKTETDVSTAQDDIRSFETLITNFEDRLNNFDGSGTSIESIVTGNQADILSVQNRFNNFDGTGNTIESEVSTIKSRLDVIEAAITGNKKWYLFCGDISFGGQDLHEPFFMNNNETQLWAYGSSATHNGVSKVADAGLTGHLTFSTSAATKNCNVRVYDNTTYLKVCWSNKDRLATDIIIDIECDLDGGFVSPTTDCTCKP